MAAKDSDPVPPVPVPPTAAVPPVEASPVVPAAPAAPAEPSAAPPAPTPYAQPAAPVPPAAGYSQPAYTPVPAGPPQGLSIASMVTGIGGVVLSLFAWGLLPAIAAVVTGHMAQKKQPYARPFWLTGLITGYVGIGISLIWGVFLLIFLIAAIGSASYFG